MSRRRFKTKTVHMVSLGCPKNTVDSQVMAAILQREGFELVPHPDEAEVIVVNTCSFIGDAREESIDVLLEMAGYKEHGHCVMLLATGCLPQQAGATLMDAMPEIDGVIGTGDLLDIRDAITGTLHTEKLETGAHFLQSDPSLRMIESGQKSAYVKVADGCSRRCAFCAIPAIRGKGESRDVDAVLAEAKRLVDAGVVELILVAQDTGAYGRDAARDGLLEVLLRRLNDIAGLKWIRLMYLYPDTVTKTLLHTMRSLPKVVPYFDVPIQHASDRILTAMRRGHDHRRLSETISTVREVFPDAVLRTTVMVGFPGETTADFDQLLSFVAQHQFSHLGAFRYSDEEGTPAFSMTPKVSKRDSYNRLRKILSVQRKIVNEHHRRLLGKELDVLVEGVEDEDGFVLVGRHKGQAPEIDGVTYLVSCIAAVGDMVRAKIVDFRDFDLVAEPVQSNQKRV